MIYFIREEIAPGQWGNCVKIGHAGNPNERRTQLQIGNPNRLEIIAQVSGTIDEERALHTLLDRDRERGEWFRMSPGLDFLIKKLCMADSHEESFKAGQRDYEQMTKRVMQNVLDSV